MPDRRVLSIAQARHLLIHAQALDGTARTVLDVVRRLGFLQLDPTSVVAPSHLLVLWSRLGPFDPAEVDRLLWHDHSLFEYSGRLFPVEDFPYAKERMLRFPGSLGAWQRRVASWLRSNGRFRRYILRELERHGPLRSRDLEDRSARPWRSAGWTHERNVTQMLQFMSARGEVFVAGREGRQRLWNLPERVLPARVLRQPAASSHDSSARRLRSLGLVRPSKSFEGAGRSVEVDGRAGPWIADPDALEHADEPIANRTTLLSPFDQLIYDRGRAEELFGFRFRLEIYVPNARREYGYYVLPILSREKLVGRLDSAYDRTTKVLRVRAVHSEPNARLSLIAVRGALRSLAEFVGADRVALP